MKDGAATASTGAGLFAGLAREQLAPSPLAPGNLRPRLPLPFEVAPAGFEGEEELAGADLEAALPGPRAVPAALEAGPSVRAPERSDRPPVLPMALAPPRSDVLPPAERKGRTISRESLPPTPMVPPPMAATERHHTLQERMVRVESTVLRERSPAAPSGPIATASRSPDGQFRLKPLLPMPAPALPSLPAARVEEPTIEIHIGRVEVRAQLAPATPSPAARAEPPDQRLASYLSGRSRGARS